MIANRRYRVEFQLPFGRVMTGAKSYVEADAAARYLQPYGATIIPETAERRRWWRDWGPSVFAVSTCSPIEPFITVRCVPARPKPTPAEISGPAIFRTAIARRNAAAKLLAARPTHKTTPQTAARHFIASVCSTACMIGLGYGLGSILSALIRVLQTP